MRIFPEVHSIFQIPQSIKSFSGFFIKDEVIPLILSIQFIPVIQLILVIQVNSVVPLILVIQVTLVTPVIPGTLVRFRIRLQNLKSGFQNLNLHFPLKCNPSLTCHSCHLTIMNKSLGNFCISGVSSNSHRSNCSPHPTNKVGRANFSEFQLCIEWGLGRGDYKKISKRMHCFIREPR